jgi:hypothetical protein
VFMVALGLGIPATFDESLQRATEIVSE